MHLLLLSLLVVGLGCANAEPQYGYNNGYNNGYNGYPFNNGGYPQQRSPFQERFLLPTTAYTITVSTTTVTKTLTSTTTCTTSTAALSTCTAGRRRRGALLPDEDWLQGEKIAPSAVERSVLDFLR